MEDSEIQSCTAEGSTSAVLRRRESKSPAARTTIPRVCDNCIRRKVKCDQNRPTCSRCLERQLECTYTSVRGKPGPPGRSSSRKAQRESSGRQRRKAGVIASNDLSSLDDAISSGSWSPDASTFQTRMTPKEPTPTSQRINVFESEITKQQEEFLLEKFFDIFRDANPIYCRENFLRSHRDTHDSKEFVRTVAILTAKLIDFFPESSELNNRIDHLLSSTHLELDTMGDSPSLNQMRRAYILAFYEFHQFPGLQSWMRLGKLTRIAYRVGLDKLEQLPIIYADWASTSEADLQEWRTLWWCIYKMDSYSNLASGTPYLIDRNYLNTALILNQKGPTPITNATQNSSKIYIPPSSENIWELISLLRAEPNTFYFNIHLVTVTVLRDVILAGRIHALHMGGNAWHRFNKIEKLLSAFRLALPPGWLNPDRNTFAGESKSDHHARIVTLFHINLSQLLLSCLLCREQENLEWARSWQKALESCQDIAKAAAQWDTSFCMKMDPAISFILSTALIFFEIHKAMCVPSATFDLEASIKQDQAILRLLLDQFAKIWMLPRLLLLSYNGFSETLCGVFPLSQIQVKAILMGYRGPMDQRWMEFLVSVRTVVQNAGQL